MPHNDICVLPVAVGSPQSAAWQSSDLQNRAPLPSPAELARRQSALAGLNPIRLAQIEARAPGMSERHTAAAFQAVEQPRSNRSRLGVALRLVEEFDQAGEWKKPGRPPAMRRSSPLDQRAASWNGRSSSKREPAGAR